MVPRRLTQPRRKNQHLVLGLLAVLTCISLIQVVRAAISVDVPPEDVGGEAIPQFGANVYQGLIAVTSGESGAALMEIGNAGQEIASTGTIRLRADKASTLQGQGIEIERDSGTGRANLLARGGVCFGAGTCLDTWPSGSGTSYWKLANQYVQPSTAGDTVQFTPLAGTSNPALDIVASNTDYTLKASNTVGDATSFLNGATLENDLLVDTRPAGDEIVIFRNNIAYPIWHAGNDGHTVTGTGPDAGRLDSIPIQFRTATGSATCSGISQRHCFCLATAFDFKCIALD